MIRTILGLIPAGSRRTIGYALALTVLSVAVRAASAVLLVPLVAALFSGDPASAWPWVAWLVLATTAGWVVDRLTARLSFALGFALLQHGQRGIADRLAQVRLTWFDARNRSTARQAVAATGPELVGLFVYLAAPAASAILLPIAIAIALLPISPLLGIAALVGVPLMLGAYWLSNRLSREADRAAAQTNTRFTDRILEFARTQQALRAARRVEPTRSHAGSELDQQHTATLRLLAMQIPGQLLLSFASQLALVLLAAATVWLAVRGQISAPEAIALMVVIARYLEPFTALAGLAAATEGILATLRRMRDVLSAPVYASGDAGFVTASPPRVSLKRVSFAYGDGAPILDALDLDLEAGTTTAIVGPSGSGKSTILALLAGLHSPDSGTIEIDGRDVGALDLESRRALTSVVFQQPFLFDATIRENIAAADPATSSKEIARAAELALVTLIVRSLPDGWETVVGESGSLLSGGERQRVSIARALLKQAPVLLVDEATSALDTENEAAVSAALAADPIPRTRVIVAHRMSSIRAADQVVFIDSGRVIEQGTIDELLSRDGRFAEFWRHQHEAANWRISSASA